ncbi:hypothetical protein GCM10010404_81670 [Nonomuraea africana]|uniref:DUF4237 domain-containing protein n=1 Tax=Nonomuraea africana TaxID=46171 RepID=A0ABR9KX45_9ACTN|nr:hypothetical protein [Nonomuraea africana]MBE1566598.1 hypothetical protein [Nonomuraea africana]
MPRHRLAFAAAAALAVAAGLPAAPAAGAVQSPPAANTVAGPAEGAAASKILKFGQAAKIMSESGNPLRISPIGVYYHRPTWKHATMPRNKYFVAIALRVTALSKPDTMPPVAGSSQLRIKQGAKVFTYSSGKAMEAPWVGRTPGTEVTAQPGSPEVIYYSFDLPKTGGILEWSGPAGAHRWQIPASNSGKATHEALLDAIADYEGR